jgi:hypothetical protein
MVTKLCYFTLPIAYANTIFPGNNKKKQRATNVPAISTRVFVYMATQATLTTDVRIFGTVYPTVGQPIFDLLHLQKEYSIDKCYTIQKYGKSKKINIFLVHWPPAIRLWFFLVTNYIRGKKFTLWGIWV